MRRITLLALPLVMSLSLPAAVASSAVEQQITASDPAQVEMAVWALDRFEAAGLDLPPVVITFPGRDQTLCGGAPARAFPTAEQAEVKVCWNDAFIVLHELAHIWEAHRIDDTRRQEFSSLRDGVTAWASQDVSWDQRGIEHAANVIAWGLLEDPYPISRTYPNDPESMIDAYRLLTGSDPLHDGGEGIIEPDRSLNDGRSNSPLELGR